MYLAVVPERDFVNSEETLEDLAGLERDGRRAILRDTDTLVGEGGAFRRKL